MRNTRKPRIQNVNALCPAGWSAEAFTMNRTIATKMIVMSNEFRTRGSMPGAIRSEIIVRSEADAAMSHPHECDGCDDTDHGPGSARDATGPGRGAA